MPATFEGRVMVHELSSCYYFCLGLISRGRFFSFFKKKKIQFFFQVLFLYLFPFPFYFVSDMM